MPRSQGVVAGNFGDDTNRLLGGALDHYDIIGCRHRLFGNQEQPPSLTPRRASPNSLPSFLRSKFVPGGPLAR